MGVIGPDPKWYEVPIPEPRSQPMEEPTREWPVEQPVGEPAEPEEVPA